MPVVWCRILSANLIFPFSKTHVQDRKDLLATKSHSYDRQPWQEKNWQSSLDSTSNAHAYFPPNAHLVSMGFLVLYRYSSRSFPRSKCGLGGMSGTHNHHNLSTAGAANARRRSRRTCSPPQKTSPSSGFGPHQDERHRRRHHTQLSNLPHVSSIQVSLTLRGLHEAVCFTR